MPGEARSEASETWRGTQSPLDRTKSARAIWTRIVRADLACAPRMDLSRRVSRQALAAAFAFPFALACGACASIPSITYDSDDASPASCASEGTSGVAPTG